MFYETVRLALISVRRNVLRSFLTLLGIVIGVAAVIAMITIGSGTTEKVKTDISKLGSNLLVVRSGRPAQPGAPNSTARALEDKDVAALVHGLTGTDAISAASQKQVRVVFGTESLMVAVTGTDTGYFAARDWKVVSGREFSDSEVRNGTGVCLLGETVRQQFFGAGDPEGATVRVGKMSCRVIGLLEPKGFSGFGQDQDNVVLMPLAAYQRRGAGNRDVETIYVAADDVTPTAVVQTRMEDILRQSRHIAPDREDDFAVRDMTQVADAMASATNVMTGMLGAVAAVSLLVGGIGIMNIMLVSVTERTREIGLRLSVGARDLDVLAQFLVEAIVLSIAGGAIGIVLGLGFSYGVSRVMQWSTVVTMQSVVLSFGVAAAIGVFFGFYPARKAAALDPIEALRFE